MENLKTQKFQLLTYLGQGILPFEQWSGVFSNPQLDSMPGLICKGYTVWFPTMIDYLNRPNDIDQAMNDLAGEKGADEAISLCLKLEKYYKEILSLFSREEQLFIIDRRLQNVHGVLSMFRSKKIKTRFYDSIKEKVIAEHIDRKDYRDIMNVFYPQMHKCEMNLRNRLVTTALFKEFGGFYLNYLKVDPYLIKIAVELGVMKQNA